MHELHYVKVMFAHKINKKNNWKHYDILFLRNHIYVKTNFNVLLYKKVRWWYVTIWSKCIKHGQHFYFRRHGKFSLASLMVSINICYISYAESQMLSCWDLGSYKTDVKVNVF